MNKRIKELADQVLPNEKEFHKGDPKDWGYFFSGDELEKFAELIVTKCIEQIPKDMDVFDRNRAIDSITKYFGIENETIHI